MEDLVEEQAEREGTMVAYLARSNSEIQQLVTTQDFLLFQTAPRPTHKLMAQNYKKNDVIKNVQEFINKINIFLLSKNIFNIHFY
jgi:hypothetical protein